MNKVTLLVNFISLSRTKTFVFLSNFPPQVRKENSLIDILTGAAIQQKNIFHIENIQQRFHKNTSFTCVFGERFNLEVSKIRKSF